MSSQIFNEFSSYYDSNSDVYVFVANMININIHDIIKLHYSYTICMAS